MPTPSMDLKGLSSPSYFSEDSCFLGQTQVRSCKSEFFPEQHGANSRKPFVSPNFQKFTPSDHLEPFSMHDRELKLGLDQYSVQNAKSPADHPQLLRSLEHDPGSVAGISAAQTSFADPRANGIVPPYENSLFSSSLPDLFSRKLKLSTRSTHFDKTMDTAPLHYDEEEPFTSIEEIESQTIGNLLPDDDDLLSGVTEGLDFVMPQPNGDDLEELDVFSNMGGMDLEDCDSSIIQRNINSGKDGSAVHNKQFSRILFVRNIDSNIDDSELQILFEQYGEVRNLYTACKQRGFIMISYYDIRAARKAMESLQNRSIRGRRLGIHYSNPKDNPTEQDTNQGILLVSNLDSSVSNDDLRSIFSAYGDIKEIQNVTQRSHQRLIQYFDTRAAEAALRTLNRSNIAGKQIKLDRFSSGRIKGFLHLSNELEQNSPSNHSLGFSGLPFRGISSSGMENGTPLGMKSSMRVPFIGSPIHHGTSSFAPDGLQSPLRVESGTPQGQSSFDVQESTNFHPHSLPEYPDGFINGIPSSPNLMGTNFGQWPPEVMDGRQLHRIGSNGHSLEQVYGSPGSSPISGHHLMWGNSSYRSQPPSGMMWQNSQSSYLNGLARLHSLPSSMLNASTLNQTNNLHHVGSAPSVNPTALWDRQQQQQQQQQPYAVGSPESSSFHPGSLGNMRFSKSSLHSVDFGPHMFPPHVGADPSKVIGLRSPHRMMFPGRGGQMVGPGLSLFDSPNERVRSRRHEGAASSQADKKQLELDVDRIIRGEDKRTTLMIKNIPNKYTSKMLLAAIDEFHRGTYDFIYLPIDFKNKCNVGYAFINMTYPTQIIPFYKAFNGKKWEKFNSEKVATLAYARIQGKSALIAHFQNSSLMNEDKRCRPILFHTEGPNAGDQIPFPMGVNVRSRPVKTRVSSFEENHQGAESSNRDSSTSPIRDSE